MEVYWILFFFQAEDGIRDGHVTGVQTCALPICFGRPSPDPGLGSMVELYCGYSCGLFNLIGGGKTLASQRITAEESPPSFLQVQPEIGRASCRERIEIKRVEVSCVV